LKTSNNPLKFVFFELGSRIVKDVEF